MATEWKVGDRLENRWEIHKIMRGGMGVVYVVHDHEWNEVLAAKTFQDAVFARNPTIAPMFTKEALAWVQLDAHPNIANAIFVQEIEGKPVLFLEYVSGGDLSGWIGTPRLTEDLPQVLKLSFQFCDGMIHARSRGIEVHRDIKPQNCLITADGTLKVTDFGLAKVFDDAGTGKPGSGGTVKPGVLGQLFGKGPASNAPEAVNPNALSFSRTGNAAGTCTHMPPEQFVDSKHVGVQADIYSFGVTLYQMLSGQLPFMGRSWEEFERLHRTQAVPPLDVKHPALRGVVEKCLAKQPAARWQDFEQLREPLAAAYEQLTGLAAPRAVVGVELDAAQWLNKGVSLNALGLDEQALACYDRALEINPHDAKAWSNKGGLIRDKGRMEEALACFDQALAIDPRADLAWYNKGATLEILGKAQEALVCLDQALAINPHNHMAWSSRGVAFDKLGRFEEAIGSFDRALKIHPRFAAALANKGNQLRNLGRMEEALACHEQAIGIDSSLRALWANKANVLSDMKRYQEALAAFDQALVLSPDFTVCLYGKGVVYMAMGQPGEALACCEHALRINPGEAYGWVYKAEALEKLGRPEEALVAYDQALEINKNDASSWLKKGSLLKGLGRTDESFACCMVVMISIKPRDALTWHNTGVQLRELGKSNEALLCHEKAVEINPRLDEAWLGKANLLVDLGRFEEALAAHDQGLAANPSSASLWYSKGATLGNADRFSEALPCFEQAHQLGHPKAEKALATCRRALADPAPPVQSRPTEGEVNMDTGALITKAHELAEQGRQAEALACCDLALAGNPGSTNAWIAKGAIFMRAKQFREALGCFEKAQHFGDQRAAEGNLICRMSLAKEAASAKPEQTAADREAAAEALYNKGAELAEQGRPDEALVSFEKVLEIMPQSTYAWYGKATVLGKLGRPEDAISSYECALVIYPEFSLALYSKGVTLMSAFKRYHEALECFEKAQKTGYAAAAQAIEICKNALAEAASAQPQAVPSSSGQKEGGKEMEFEELMEKTKSLLAKGQPEFAMTFCVLALAKNPDSPEAWNIKGSIMMGKDDFRGALESFENAQRVGGDPRAAQGIAMCRAALGEPVAPVSGQASSEPAITANAWFYKGEDLDKEGRPAEALACFEKALEIDPSAAYTWYSKGVALGKLNRPQEEINSYDQALKINPNFAEAWFNKAITLGNARRFRDALECFVKAQALGHPDAEQGIRYCQNALSEEAAGSTADADAWLKKGTDIVVQGGNPAEALACFEKALAMAPRLERAWWGKGVVLGNLGRLEESLAAYDGALAVNPSATGPLNSKAAALFNASRIQEALAFYEMARELGDPKAIQGMIMCRQALGLPPIG